MCCALATSDPLNMDIEVKRFKTISLRHPALVKVRKIAVCMLTVPTAALSLVACYNDADGEHYDTYTGN